MKCERKVCTNEADNCIHSDGTRRNYCIHCAILINKNNPEVPYLIKIPKHKNWKCDTLNEQLDEFATRKTAFDLEERKEDKFLYAFVRGYANWNSEQITQNKE